MADGKVHNCPLSDAIVKRFVVYVQRCLASDSEIAKTCYTLWHMVWSYGLPYEMQRSVLL